MNFFKKQTSNDYYDTYKKEELGVGESDGELFSLNTVIKLEFISLVAGLMFMGYNSFFNHYSIEFKENFLTQNLFLTKSNKNSNLDSELVSQLEESETDTISDVKIQEESTFGVVSKLAQSSTYKPEDIALIVEIIKSQMTTNISTIAEDSIIISQN